MANSCIERVHGLMKGVWYARLKSRKTKWFTCTHLLSQTWIPHRNTLSNFTAKEVWWKTSSKKAKSGFDFASVSSHARIVNANRLQVHALAYNIFNWFRRLALSANMRKQRIDTVRLKLLKIAAKVVHSARYITFKRCSSCPYKNEFYETLSNIGKLNVQLE